MTDDLRRAIAYIAGRMIRSADASAVYDHGAGAYFQFSGEVSPAKVEVYDFGRSCHLNGTPPSLYDFGTSSFFDFKTTGTKFEGYDYESSSFYDGTVDSENITVYDYDKSEFFNYTL